MNRNVIAQYSPKVKNYLVASGGHPSDGMPAGVLASRLGTPLLLVKNNHRQSIHEQYDFTQARQAEIYIFVGGSVTLSNDTLNYFVQPKGTISQSLQRVLNKYKGQPVRVFYQNLISGEFASLNPDGKVYGASVPKVVLVAYVQNLIERGVINWNMPIKYTDKIYQHPESYAWGGSGSIQYENFRNKTYSLRDVVNRTIRDSDNLGANLLLHYIGYRDKVDFNRFTKSVYGAPQYTLNITAREINKVMTYIYDQKEKQALRSMSRTDYDGTKMDVLPVTVQQKIGEWWPKYNHTTGIVNAKAPYTLTILTNHWENWQIQNLVKEIYRTIK